MFEPPRCPHTQCPMHAAPAPSFYIRRGYYRSKSKAHPIPRYRCRECRRGFSRQTFRHDFQDKKPYLNVSVIKSLCSGVGYRQSARMLGLTRRNFVNKARKIQRTMGGLGTNLLERAGEVDLERPRGTPVRIQFDEFESYELCRNTMPLSIPTAVESDSRMILGAEAAPIRPRGVMTKKRMERIHRHAKRYGERVDESAGACRRVFARAAEFRPAASWVELDTDCKTTYRGFASEAFGGVPVVHAQTLGSDPRGSASPLAAINLTEAMMRDLGGRLRRQSWLVSKAYRYLNLQLGMYMAWRNWTRPRFNRDTRCPGQIAGLAARRLRPGELVGWRQDWGARSPSPYGDGGRAVGQEWGRRTRAA